MAFLDAINNVNPNILAMALGMGSNLFNPGGQQGANFANVANTAMSLAQQQQQAKLLAQLLGGQGGQSTVQQPIQQSAPVAPTPEQSRLSDNAAGFEGSLFAFNEGSTPQLANQIGASGALDTQPATQGMGLDAARSSLLTQMLGGSAVPFGFPRVR